VRARASKEYWNCLCLSSGRPFCAAMSKSAKWGVTQGDDDLKQEFTTTENNSKLIEPTTGGNPSKRQVSDPSSGTSTPPSSEGEPLIEPSPALLPAKEEDGSIPAIVV